MNNINTLLETAIKNNELHLFIMGDPKYSADEYDKNTGYSTNYRTIASSISSLENSRPDLKQNIKNTLLNMLSQDKPGWIIKIAKIVVCELRSGRQGSVLTEEDVLVSLRSSINRNLDKLYEEELKDLQLEDNLTFNSVGKHIM